MTVSCFSHRPYEWDCDCTYTESSWKYTFLFAHYFEAKVGRGVLLEYSICLVLTPLPRSLQSLICVRFTVGAFWKNGSFSESVLRESALLLLIISQEASKQLASSWWQWTTLHKLAFPVQPTKALVVAIERGYSNIFNTKKASSEDAQYVYMRKKIPM